MWVSGCPGRIFSLRIKCERLCLPLGEPFQKNRYPAFLAFGICCYIKVALGGGGLIIIFHIE